MEKKTLVDLVLPPKQCPVCHKYFIHNGNEYIFIGLPSSKYKGEIKRELCNSRECHFGGFSSSFHNYAFVGNLGSSGSSIGSQHLNVSNIIA